MVRGLGGVLLQFDFIVQTSDSHDHSDVLAIVTDRAMMMITTWNFISFRAV